MFHISIRNWEPSKYLQNEYIPQQRIGILANGKTERLHLLVRLKTVKEK